jgi:DNA-binding SARP family transcriptional activator
VWRRDADGTWKPIEKEAWGKGRPTRSVFKRLLATPGRRLSRGRLAEDLWPDVEDFEPADKYLYNAMSVIRSVIGKDLVKTWEAIYELADQSLIWVDSDACEALLKEAENRGHASIEALPLLEQAVKYLERGELLEGESGTWVYGLRKKSEDVLRQGRLWLAEGYEVQGKLLQAGFQYRAILQTVPLDEDALQQWMGMLQRHGRPQEALKCYQDVKSVVEAQGFALSPAIEKQAAILAERSNNAPAPFGKLLGSRHFLELPIWTGSNVLSSLPALSNNPLEQLPTLGEPLHINKETLHLFTTLTDLCRHLSEGNELRIAEQVLWAYLPKIEVVARLSAECQDIAANIASQGYLLAASLIGHRNDFLGRLRYSEQALRYGELAGDLNLQTVAMRQIAISFDCMDRPDKVLEASQQTFSHLKDVSPLLRACIYSGVSGAYAELGQEQESRHFMDLAYEHFPKQPENEPGYLHTICRYSTLIFFDALNHLGFGRPREAENILARIDGLQPKMQLPERVRIELLNYQIAVFVALNAMEQACTYLEAATEAARSIGSKRHFQESFTLFHRMRKTWHHEPQVQALADLFE